MLDPVLDSSFLKRKSQVFLTYPRSNGGPTGDSVAGQEGIHRRRQVETVKLLQRTWKPALLVTGIQRPQQRGLEFCLGEGRRALKPEAWRLLLSGVSTETTTFLAAAQILERLVPSSISSFLRQETWDQKTEPLDRGWDVWMASPTQWTWVWANARRQRRTGKAGTLQPMRLQRARQKTHSLATGQQDLLYKERWLRYNYTLACIQPRINWAEVFLYDDKDCFLSQ